MTHGQTMLNVVLPQVFRNILPSVANEVTNVSAVALTIVFAWKNNSVKPITLSTDVSLIGF